MKLRTTTMLAAIISAGIALSCSETPTSPKRLTPRGSAPDLVQTATPSIVISQIYGGGGNSGATLRNDFIELHNPGSSTISVAGWSVQYTSAGGTTWQATALTGSIPPGGYYLVQESQGAGGSVNLPTPDASGTIAMSANNGKVWLVTQTTLLTGACPTTNVVDQVSFGTTASVCNDAVVGRNNTTTPSLTNTTAAIRQDPVSSGGLPAGCKFTGDLAQDFAVGAPAPRNSASPVSVCAGALPLGPLDHVALTGATTVLVGGTAQLTAKPQDSNNQLLSAATVAWSSSDESIATVSATGLVTGVAANASPVTITATATADGITKFATLQMTVANPEIHWIDFSSSTDSMPPGFQAQLFATARVSNGGMIVPATFTFESLDPAIATVQTVQNTGLITAVAPPADGVTKPRIRIIATQIGGAQADTFDARPLRVESLRPAPPSIYAKNDEFGDPTPASASNVEDFLVTRLQYTLSYNETRGTPNWVSYELDARQMGSEDRCNCFTADPLLPASKQIFTSDYTNGGFDRGHMTRSADRTAGNTDNAATFYLTNVVPQRAALNQGVWAQFENMLGDSAEAGRSVYIITGPLYSRSHGLTFLKNEGKVAIPDSTWKVAFIGPRNGGVPFTLANIQSWGDRAGTTVLAVNMPNDTTVRFDPPSKYFTTVDKIEDATGYDFLSLLPVAFQAALEAGDHSPKASFTSSGTLSEGSTITFDASGSTDPDIGRTDLGRTEALTHVWHFSDGTNAMGPVVTHTFANNGTYTASLTVTDAFGWQSLASSNGAIANVAPSIAPLSGVTLLPGETYSGVGSFTDPGADTWSATVDYGDGEGAQTLALDGKTFALSYTYRSAGRFTIRVNVNDGDATASVTAAVLVETSLAGVSHVSDAIDALGGSDGALSNGETNSLQSKVRNAQRQLQTGNGTPAANMLGALVNELEAMVQSGRLSPAAASPIIDYTRRVIASIGG